MALSPVAGPAEVEGGYEDGTLLDVEDPRAMVSLAGGIVTVPFERVAVVGAPAEPLLEAAVSADGGDLEAELTYATTGSRARR